MPRTSHFESSRMRKLLGIKTKPIYKPSFTQGSEALSTPAKLSLEKREPATSDKSEFRATNYIQMSKLSIKPDRSKHIHTQTFKVYQDAEVFGKDEADDLIRNFLKQNHDHDNDTPEEQVRYDVNRGIKKLREDLERRLHGDEDMPSERGRSVGGLTPASYSGIRIAR